MRMYSVRLLVQDFGTCFRFYRDIIGLAPVWGDESGPYADFRVGDETMLALFSRDLMSEAVGTADLPSAAREQDSFVVVLQVDDVDAAHKRLAEKGADFVNAPKDYPGWTIRAVHLRDPEGNLLEMFSPLGREHWTEEVEQKDRRTAAQDRSAANRWASPTGMPAASSAHFQRYVPIPTKGAVRSCHPAGLMGPEPRSWGLQIIAVADLLDGLDRIMF
ncbi:hypothetical protein HBA54_13740 [Pelagibius litoralis]|uniref:VOC domain-containing protein n=1 Tax=Pelagibius litoralis TaxID=374515 RepID=A0A967KA43_9PROT|nr:VOC family protein [Pelagibius litoralis]NIA69659.1 hypothetical protein [Pelagibius litoralis]